MQVAIILVLAFATKASGQDSKCIAATAPKGFVLHANRRAGSRGSSFSSFLWYNIETSMSSQSGLHNTGWRVGSKSLAHKINYAANAKAHL